jgi:hypothetical protein
MQKVFVAQIWYVSTGATLADVVSSVYYKIVVMM